MQIWLARTRRVEVARHNPKLLNSLSIIAISNNRLTRDPCNRGLEISGHLIFRNHLIPKLIHAFGIVLFWIDETKELLFDLGVVDAPLKFGVVVVLGEP